MYRSREEQGGQETEADSSDRDIKRLFLFVSEAREIPGVQSPGGGVEAGVAGVSGSLYGTSSIHIVTGVPQRDEC